VWVSVVVLACLVFVLALSLRNMAKETSRTCDLLLLSEANALCRAEQVDGAFRELVQVGTFDGELTESSRRILETWVQHDRQFLERTGGNEALQAERATAHRRLGQGLLYLRRRAEAADHLRRAGTLFEELRRENPAELSYANEAFDAYVKLAETLGALNRGEEGMAALEKASAIFPGSSSGSLLDSESELREASSNEVLTALLIRRCEPDQAIHHMLDIVEMRRRLCDGFPEDVRHAQALCRSCAALERLLEGFGRSSEAANFRADTLGILEDLVRRFPADPRLQHALTRTRSRVNEDQVGQGGSGE
jgi:tetratricopeptide (TPR) repeat protein